MTQISEAPAHACLMAGGEVTFAEPKTENGATTYPIKMLARSSKPIDHWFWGKVVHDMAGFSVHKGRIPVDYIHDEPIGYLDKWEATPEGLVVEGALVLTEDPTDPAPKLVARHRGGVPYEASINFGGDGLVYEFIDDHQTTEVNGYQFNGPGIVIREWPLRGVAVCPYGADMNTESQFSGRAAEKFSVKQKGGQMAKTEEKPAAELKADEVKPTELSAEPAAVEAKPEEKPAAELSSDDVDPLAAGRAEAKRFADAFGEMGAKWFAEGLSYDDALARQLKSLRDENAELRQKLSAPKADGEDKPVTFQDGETKKRTGFAGKIRIASAPISK